MIFPPHIGVTKMMHNEYRFTDECDENNKIIIVTCIGSDRSGLQHYSSIRDVISGDGAKFRSTGSSDVDHSWRQRHY
jgi:hypothetical protein